MVALLSSNECGVTVELARKARQANLPFFAVLNHGCTRDQVLREAYGNGSSRVGKDSAAVDEEPPGVLLVPYFEDSDVHIVLSKMVAMRVSEALVVYDHVFGMRMPFGGLWLPFGRRVASQ
ncbi:hypothetical protein V5799_011544 [Amblyomma americanum]|uniref:Uncharacterized protein n=1 Tax=Amblyomma americanum TaxID=6943 RepID=A0AAQ4EGZ7_AMBAM